MGRFKIVLIILVSLLVPAAAGAQRVALKTNAVNDLLLSPNLGLEVGLAPKWTLDIGVQGNFWSVNGHSWKHAFVQPEARYWFCQRFSGHFIGAHLLGGAYNFGNLDMNFKFLGSDFSQLRNKRYQGWAAGAGIVYGYAHPLSRHWNLEAVIGIGWLHTRFDSYPCATCGTKIENDKPHNYFGPTKVALNFVYLF